MGLKFLMLFILCSNPKLRRRKLVLSYTVLNFKMKIQSHIWLMFSSKWTLLKY